MSSQPKLRVTWMKSTIGTPARQKATVRALGLRRLHQTVFQNDNPAIRGMLHAVRHLVRVQPATEEEIAASQAAKVAKAPAFVILAAAPAEAPMKRERTREAPAATAEAKNVRLRHRPAAKAEAEPAPSAAPPAIAVEAQSATPAPGSAGRRIGRTSAAPAGPSPEATAEPDALAQPRRRAAAKEAADTGTKAEPKPADRGKAAAAANVTPEAAAETPKRATRKKTEAE